MITYSDIFHSSGNPLRSINYGNINELVNTGVITASRRPLATPSVLHIHALNPRHPDNANDPTRRTAYPPEPYYRAVVRIKGGLDHTWLAAMAFAFLVELGHEVLDELVHGSRRVDLASKDRSWFIECGDTNAAWIYDDLHEHCTRFCVLPFAALYEPPFMYHFERGPNWVDPPRTIANAGVRLK